MKNDTTTPAEQPQGALKPSAAVLCKLGSIAVHVEEMLSPAGHHFDIGALKPLLEDKEVRQWLKQMNKLALILDSQKAIVSAAVMEALQAHESAAYEYARHYPSVTAERAKETRAALIAAIAAEQKPAPVPASGAEIVKLLSAFQTAVDAYHRGDDCELATEQIGKCRSDILAAFAAMQARAQRAEEALRKIETRQLIQLVGEPHDEVLSDSLKEIARTALAQGGKG